MSIKSDKLLQAYGKCVFFKTFRYDMSSYNVNSKTVSLLSTIQKETKRVLFIQ